MADNILALNGEWDMELLRKEMAVAEDELRKLDVFSDQQYDDLLAELGGEDSATDEDDIPNVEPTPVSLSGDLWLLGNHRLFCGDGADGIVRESAGGSKGRFGFYRSYL